MDPSKGEEDMEAVSQIDPFLLEALENPRHRLTVLRMELDVQQFMLAADQFQFEFQTFPTSYLRCAAHRVAQHYGLQTLSSVDNITDGLGSRIVVRKTLDSRYPPIRLSDVPIKQHNNDKAGQIKIVVRRRPGKASLCDALENGKGSLLRTMEERMEEYDKARARIFSCSSDSATAKSSLSTGDEQQTVLNATEEQEKVGIRDATSSRIAIFRDREKDRSDPDYNRSYERYVSGFAPCHNFSMGVSNIHQPSGPSPMHDGGFSQLAFRPPVRHTVSMFDAVGYNQTCPGAVYMQWTTPAMMYAQSYEHFRNAVFQAPVYQQPLSFDHMHYS
ncbi:hypothetical protein KSP40_PGU015010 [Platanthera guangdongensis]|uniref:SUZ domain-containing protein n=1 Tax=Platanthera guangdongensis TaxID=2320717 RepID=A0ABR2M8W3_9ASPA